MYFVRITLYPENTLWHNDLAIFDADDIEDFVIAEGDPNSCDRSTFNGWRVHELGDNSDRYGFRLNNVAGLVGSNPNVLSAICSTYAWFADENGYIFNTRVWKYLWDEEDVSYNEWDCTSDFDWATVGCDNASDGGSDNTGDGTGADRMASAIDSVQITFTPGWYVWDMDTALVRDWADGTAEEGGVIFIGTLNPSGDTADVRLRDQDDGSNPAKVYITYVSAEEKSYLLIKE